MNDQLTRNDSTARGKRSSNKWSTVCEHVWFWLGANAGNDHEDESNLWKNERKFID